MANPHEPSLPPVVQTPSNLRSPRADARQGTVASGQDGGMMRNRPLILAVLFGVSGALGLPLLWYSPSFSTKEKWLWSIAIIVYTLLLVGLAVFGLVVLTNALQNQIP